MKENRAQLLSLPSSTPVTSGMKALSIIIGIVYLSFFIIEVGGIYAGIKVRLSFRLARARPFEETHPHAFLSSLAVVFPTPRTSLESFGCNTWPPCKQSASLDLRPSSLWSITSPSSPRSSRPAHSKVMERIERSRETHSQLCLTPSKPSSFSITSGRVMLVGSQQR